MTPTRNHQAGCGWISKPAGRPARRAASAGGNDGSQKLAVEAGAVDIVGGGRNDIEERRHHFFRLDEARGTPARLIVRPGEAGGQGGGVHLACDQLASVSGPVCTGKSGTPAMSVCKKSSP
jgi:hypothetical protein